MLTSFTMMILYHNMKKNIYYKVFSLLEYPLKFSELSFSVPYFNISLSLFYLFFNQTFSIFFLFPFPTSKDFLFLYLSSPNDSAFSYSFPSLIFSTSSRTRTVLVSFIYFFSSKQNYILICQY